MQNEETPRGKLRARGPAALTDAELLSIPMGCNVDDARSVLAQFGGIRQLMHAKSTEIGEAQFTRLNAVAEIGRRYLAEALPQREAIRDPAGVKRFLTAQIRDLDHEQFHAIWLNNQHGVIAHDVLSRGTIDGASVYPREVVKTVLQRSAAAVIFAHNHPSGSAEPSAADRSLTERLRGALSTIDIRVLDHFVVGETVVSFAERGWL